MTTNMIWTEPKYAACFEALMPVKWTPVGEKDADIMFYRTINDQWLMRRSTDPEAYSYPINPHSASCILERAARLWLAERKTQVILCDGRFFICQRSDTRQAILWYLEAPTNHLISFDTFAEAQLEAMLAVMVEEAKPA